MAIHPGPGPGVGSPSGSQLLLPGCMESITKILCVGGGGSHILNASSFHPFSQALTTPNLSGLLRLALALDLTTCHREPGIVKHSSPPAEPLIEMLPCVPEASPPSPDLSSSTDPSLCPLPPHRPTGFPAPPHQTPRASPDALSSSPPDDLTSFEIVLGNDFARELSCPIPLQISQPQHLAMTSVSFPWQVPCNGITHLANLPARDICFSCIQLLS